MPVQVVRFSLTTTPSVAPSSDDSRAFKTARAAPSARALSSCGTEDGARRSRLPVRK